jgi:hypothetical protein
MELCGRLNEGARQETMTINQVAIAVVLLFLVACSAPATTPAPPTPIPVLLTGNWQPLSKSADAMFLQLNSDGTCRQASSLDGLTGVPQVECTYTFEGTDLSMTAVKLHGVPACPSATGVYAVQLVADNQIQLVATKDTCGPRKRSTAGAYQRIP